MKAIEALKNIVEMLQKQIEQMRVKQAKPAVLENSEMPIKEISEHQKRDCSQCGNWMHKCF